MAETRSQLDIRKVLRRARQQMGQTRHWQANQIAISRRVHRGGGNWEDVTQPVRIVHSPRHFGGQQAYFACPGLPYQRACNRRAIKLYLHNDQYVCRRCARLANAVENEDKMDRARRRASAEVTPT